MPAKPTPSRCFRQQSRISVRFIALFAFSMNIIFRLWYKEIVGGALAISMRDYKAINGYSNMYWGWGGEGSNLNNILNRELINCR